MEPCTYDETPPGIGQTVIAEVGCDAGRAQKAASQHGTVIGVHTEYILLKECRIVLAVQFGLDNPGAIPRVVFASNQDSNKYLGLFRLNHRLPWGETHPEIMQRTTEFQHHIAETLLPQPQAILHNATAFDTTIDVFDPPAPVV